jgi:thiol-disulfide isomerase/thioredoxin/uncharacterized membrane protein YphA (DoxX/SURF4 family)
MHTALLIIRLLLAAVFALAAVTKLADLRGSREAVSGFGVPARLAAPLGTLLPFVELAVAVALLPRSSARFGAVGGFALLALFAAAIARSIARGEAPDCHCFGQLHSEPAGWRTLARNGALGGLAAFAAIAGWHGPGPSATAWIGRLHGAGTVAFVGGIAVVLLAALTACGLLALLRQNGRLLLRIDELEERLDAIGAPAPAAPHHGLPIGELAPTFTLDGLYGERVTLEALTASDRTVMLLFTDPRCGPCNALMPQISDWQREHAAGLTLAVLTRGSAEDNRSKVREHGIENVWLDSDLDVYNAYHSNGTPGAVLVDHRGRIASAVVGGPDAIAGLVAEAIGDPAPAVVPVVQVPARPAPPAPPPSLPIGANAPELELRGLTGETVPLTDPDRDTLVVFWNPGCGFCQRMLDDVRAFEQSPPAGAPRLLLVSTGSIADNEAMGLDSEIALDGSFAAGSAFGTTGTPSAIRVGSDGKIASGLAVGAPGVMALASAAAVD